ncbi:hypothetical protein GmHk_14G041489 [Glycine max]|nr:hypothetical protein GmHk_14G041489 [Glycine max]
MKRLHPSKVAAKAITLSIRQQFENWFEDPKEENEIKKAFNLKASHRLSEMFRDARNENKRPYWIGDRVWNDLLSHWNAPEYRSKSNAASSVGESQLTPLDPAGEQRLRSRCWVAAARPKHKGCLYGTGDLAHTYKCGNDSFMQHMQGSSNRATDATEINRLREELRQSKEEMHIFQSVVLQFPPPEV